METRRKTTAGVLFWTPAPVRPSPASSVDSDDDAWEDEGQAAGSEDDFESQVDENGIIGLSDALEDVGFGEAGDGADAGCDPDEYPGPNSEEEPEPSGSNRTRPPEELSYSLSEHLSNTESAGEEILASCFDMMGSLKALNKKRYEHLGVMKVEEHGDKEGKRSKRKTKKHKHKSTSGKLGATDGLSEGFVSRGANEEISSTSYSVEPPGLSNHPASAVTPPSLLHLLHVTAEELAAAPGIEAETLPEMGFTESLPESHCSRKSLKSSPRRPETNLGASPQPSTSLSEEDVSDHYRRTSESPREGSGKSGHKQSRKTMNRSPEAMHSRTRPLSAVGSDSIKSKQKNTSSDRTPKTPRGRSKAAAVDESRKASPSYQTPDFSKVEPKVRFPKDSYSPPKSRLSGTRDSLSPESPFVFKSPADIVKEVLLNTTDGSAASSECDGSPTGATNSTVPLDFRSKRNATTLLEQLQEAYNSLLTKYAEAENTIDRLRLEAKVSLYSDPPKPGHSVQAGLSHDPSKFIKLDFPQAQKAEITPPPLHPNGHNSRQGSSAACRSPRSPLPQIGQQLASILFTQTDKFLQQLQTFESLLKSDKLQPSEQRKGLAQLAEGLDSLERGYLLARDEHKVLQQRGVEISHFDPERELEGLIFHCGLRIDELKEQVEQMRWQQPACEASPTPSPQPTSSSTLSMAAEAPIHPQSPPEPLLVDPGEAAQVEVSSASNESELEDEDEDEETLNSLYLKPPNGELTFVEEDFSMTDHYQSFKELPRPLDHSLEERGPPSAALKGEMQPEDEEDERLSLETENSEVWKTLPQSDSLIKDHPDSPVATSKQWSSRSSPPSYRASNQSTPVPPSSGRRLELKKSHSSSLSSLGDVPPSERRSSKDQTGSRRAPSQDGIISPEMDSGFVGSESSRLTPAAAPSPVQQRASESSASAPQEGNSGSPPTGPVSTPSPSSSSSHRRTAPEPRLDSPFKQPRRTRPGQRRRTFSCSPQHWVSQRDPTPVDSVLESESTPTGSEDSDRCCYRSTDSLHISHSGSSRAARHHHGDSQAVANCDDAIQTLQAEVTRLKERLESCVRNKKPLGSQHSTSTPRVRSVEQRRETSGGRRETQAVNEAEDESVLRRTARSTCAQRQKPQRDILRRSDLDSCPPHPPVSRCTQTSAALDSSYQHTSTVRSRRTQTQQHPVVSEQPSAAADGADSSRPRAFLCPQCLSGRRGQTEHPAGRIRESTLPSGRCSLCGRLESNRRTEPDCRRHSESPAHISCRPAESDRTTGSRYFTAAASPALLEYRPVGPPPLLLFPTPVYVSPSVGSPSAVRSRRRRSLSADKQLSVDGSLNRAIRAARNMKHTSRHMARSLASGLQYQELLTQSCSY